MTIISFLFIPLSLRETSPAYILLLSVKILTDPRVPSIPHLKWASHDTLENIFVNKFKIHTEKDNWSGSNYAR